MNWPIDLTKVYPCASILRLSARESHHRLLLNAPRDNTFSILSLTARESHYGLLLKAPRDISISMENAMPNLDHCGDELPNPIDAIAAFKHFILVICMY